jgi:hypothetical protein
MRGASLLPVWGWRKIPKSVEDLPAVRLRGATVTVVVLVAPGSSTLPRPVPIEFAGGTRLSCNRVSSRSRARRWDFEELLANVDPP